MNIRSEAEPTREVSNRPRDGARFSINSLGNTHAEPMIENGIARMRTNEPAFNDGRWSECGPSGAP